MTITHFLDTGTHAQIRIRDQTDNPDSMTIDVAMRVTGAVVSVPQMPWAMSTDGINRTGWRSYDFKPNNNWQVINATHGANRETYTFHLGDTNSPVLGGPVDFTIDIYAFLLTGDNLVNIRVGGQPKKAIPYLRHAGLWKPVKPWVRTPSGWKETT